MEQTSRPTSPAAAAPQEPARPGHRLRVHLFLFGLTCVTTTLAIGLWHFDAADPWPEALRRVLVNGGLYSVTLMSILTAHEMGHYLMARRHGTPVSLPYFLPGPPFLSFGTFGAFIRMEHTARDREALIDIGLGGPLAGLAVALPALALGLWLSELQPVAALRGGLFEGNSLLYMLMKRLVVGEVPPGYDVTLHPVAFAGWMGLLVTSLNLFPIGQLDGGHVAHALLGPRIADPLARATYGGLLALAVWLAVTETLFVWVVWAGLIGFIGLGHPPTEKRSVRPLGWTRRALGALGLALFALTFTPVPLSDEPSGGWQEDRDAPEVPGGRRDTAGPAPPDPPAGGARRGPDGGQPRPSGGGTGVPPLQGDAGSAGRQPARQSRLARAPRRAGHVGPRTSPVGRGGRPPSLHRLLPRGSCAGLCRPPLPPPPRRQPGPRHPR